MPQVPGQVMAGDWIKLQHVTPDKPEIYLIATEIGTTPEDAFGRCCRVWIWADQQSLNGHALSVTNVTLDSIARRDGFATAMQLAGWLVINHDGTVSFPHFDRHNGKTAKNRALAAERKALERAKSHDESVTEVSNKSRSERDKTVTREEKSIRKPPISPKGDIPGFAAFWNAYPKKVGKGAAEKAFQKSGINGKLSEILTAIAIARETDQWRKDEGQYIPNPATWLNQRRWEDGATNTDDRRDWI